MAPVASVAPTVHAPASAAPDWAAAVPPPSRPARVQESAVSASKFGVVGLAQSLAAEMASSGVRVNCVSPGQIATQMLDAVIAAHSDIGLGDETPGADGLAARIPSGRLGTPEDVADTCLYLASDLSGYFTGQSLVVDGGWQVG